MFFDRNFPRRVDFFNMYLRTFQCFTCMCSVFNFLKTVYFWDLFDILKLEHIEGLTFCGEKTQENNVREWDSEWPVLISGLQYFQDQSHEQFDMDI